MDRGVFPASRQPEARLFSQIQSRSLDDVTKKRLQSVGIALSRTEKGDIISKAVSPRGKQRSFGLEIVVMI
jgi:hypothetical protein